MKISKEQIAAVMKLPGPRRYLHFIKQVADQNRVWGLYADGWALAGADDGKELFPLWPAREYAAACADGLWSGYEPREIAMEEFFEELIPALKERQVGITVFYTPTDKGVVPSLVSLQEDLREELRRIE